MTTRDATIDLRQTVASNTPKAVELWLEVTTDSDERERQLAALSPAERRGLGDLLDANTGAELLCSVEIDLAARLLKSMSDSAAARVLQLLNSPDAADILRELDEHRREAVLGAMPIERARALLDVLAWPEDSVAARMHTDTPSVVPSATIAEAVDQIRDYAAAHPDGAVGASVCVVDADNTLRGAVRLRELVLAQPQVAIGTLMRDVPVTVTPLTDIEEAAKTLIEHKLDELPVVDAEGRLLGILVEDDAIEAVEREATEDAEHQGGSEPLDVPYLRASPWLLWRKRIVWLLVLFAAEAYTGTVLRAFEDEMEAVVALAFFIPLLIGTGGNTGTQITTTLVRAMGTGQIRFRDLPAIVSKEMSTGFLIAVAMAAAALIRAWTLGVGPEVTLTVCLTVAAIVLWASLVSSVLPLVLRKLRVDPAVVSAPMIATVVDGTGLMIYFWIAHLTLPQLAGL
ncbi:magnesium transporter [Mycolicibacterium smegmatis]|uniref:magnesium transporter n=1 Tax=Mycolicibacterium smegmatis TaxID=1772 RepID=UPI001E485B81|nr:magnesium transporter [Mycolicibacterium smegmatis]UGU28856.1 magnesium transporter [Mycolicibacterium smegmatis]